MLSKYRLGYLGIAAALMLGVAIVSAETEPRRLPAAEALQKLKNQITAPDSEPAEGIESGNLSEAGARELLTKAQVADVIAASDERPVLVFKHSTQCPISGAAYRRVRDWLESKGDDAPSVYLVKVIERRPVSKLIEKRVNVKHESPQIILLKDETARWNTSHEDVTAEAIEKALKKVAGDDAESS